MLLVAIRSLVKALEASSYWTAGLTERVIEYALGIGRVMGLDVGMLDKLKIRVCFMTWGKIGTPKETLNKNGKLEHDEWAKIKRHPGRGAYILVELKQFEEIIQSVKYHHEHWDGQGGIFGLKGEQIPLNARILAVADAFDAMTSDRPCRQMRTKAQAVRR